MDDIAYDTDALEEARAIVAAEASRMPGLGDRFGSTPAPDLGTLEASRETADAITALTRALVADLEAAGARLHEAERALGAASRLVRSTEGRNSELLAAAGA
jgi:hypothetical protein